MGADTGVLSGHEIEPDDGEYATPPEVWRPLADAVGGFDTDPASGAEPEAIATTRYTAEDNGLSKPWRGWVFVNPPWSSSDGSTKERWLSKARSQAVREGVDGVVVLLPVDTSAYWFHDHVLEAKTVCFLGPGRVSFPGEDRNPSFQLLVAVFGAVTDELTEALHSLGSVIHRREVREPTTQTTLGDR